MTGVLCLFWLGYGTALVVCGGEHTGTGVFFLVASAIAAAVWIIRELGLKVASSANSDSRWPVADGLRTKPLDLDAIRARADKATPWHARPYDTGRPRGVCAWVIPPQETHIDRIADCGADLSENMADAEFIAHARQDIPALLAEIERLQEALGRVVEDFPDANLRGRGDFYAENLHRARDVARAALAAQESAEA